MADEADKFGEVRNHIDNALRLLGSDCKKESGMRETPGRVARFLIEFHQPFDPIACLKSFDHEEVKAGHPMVVVSNIPLGALCEHHLCPFFGSVHIGYIPGNRIVGLSKFSRLVAGICHRRPTVQERLTEEIAEAIEDAIQPKGTIVVSQAEHTCMTVRGVKTPGVKTTASAIKGNYIMVPAARAEFFELLKVG